MAIIKKYVSFQNLSNFKTLITDQTPNSTYFRISEFQETFTGGKNGFLIEGSEFLKETTELRVEILDVEGNPIYFQPASGVPEYYEGVAKLVSVYVYETTPVGIGKITILGELKSYVNNNGEIVPVPDEWKKIYNVKWERTFYVDKHLTNKTPVRFAAKPTVNITELSKPIFDKTIPTVTQSGSVQGIAQIPLVGSDLQKWSVGTEYKLKILDNTNWTGSVVGTTIDIPSISYSAIVREVLNAKEVLVDTPYTQSDLVTNFTSSEYTASFEHFENSISNVSSFTGSFAKINIANLQTYTGDVSRVKVFRKSRNEVGDYQFIQEYKLESNELLLDITTLSDTQVSYGSFTPTSLQTYWVTSSVNHPVTVNYDILHSSAKIDYNSSFSSTPQLLYTTDSFDFNSNLEYTLSFKTLLSGSLVPSSTIYTYLSSSDFTQSLVNISGSSTYVTRTNINQNIISANSGSAKLVFEVWGGDWYISDISLRAAEETSFSPDEFSLIQDVPRKLTTETFDFKFEFYDVNNNFIPVTVLASKQFSLGNTNISSILSTASTGSTAKVVRLNADSYVVTYDAAGNTPSPSTIAFDATSSNFTNGYFKFTGGGAYFTDETTYTDGAGINSDSASFTVPTTYFSTPLQFEVGVADGDQIEIASDTISIFAVKPGQSGSDGIDGSDVAPYYFIQPLSGSQIKNTTGSLELQVQRINSTGSTDISGGAIVLYAGANKLASSMVGVTDGGNGIGFNPIISHRFITGSRIITLKDSGSNKVYDTIALLDVTDGLGGGSFITSNLKTSRNPQTNVYTPTQLYATASFYSTTGTEYRKSVRIYPSVTSSLDYMAIYSESGSSYISFTANDGDGGSVTIGGAAVPTKDVVLTADFTDPATSQSLSITETFYIISDGADGIDSLTIINDNIAHTLPASSAGVVGDYVGSGFNLYVYEGINQLVYDPALNTNGDWTIYSHSLSTGSNGVNFTTGSVTDMGNYVTIGDHSAISNNIDSFLITYFITGSRRSGSAFNAETSQTITKAKSGTDGTNGATGASGPGVVFRGDWDNLTTYYSSSTRRDVVQFNDADASINYWLSNMTASTTGSGQPSPSSSDWGMFEQYFSSVATDILFAQDVYVNRTINIGSDGGSPLIALNSDFSNAGANPFISIGQDIQGFGNNGIFIGYDDGSPKFSFVTSSGAVSFTTSSLYVSGTISGSNIYGSFISGSTISAGNLIGSTIIGSSITVPNTLSSSFSVDSDGNVIASSVSISGSLNITDGIIGNWEVQHRDEGGKLRSVETVISRSITLDPELPEISMTYSGSQSIRITPLNSFSEVSGTPLAISDLDITAINLADVVSSGSSTAEVFGVIESQSFSSAVTVAASGVYTLEGVTTPYTMTLNAPSSIGATILYPTYTPSSPTYHGVPGGSITQIKHKLYCYLIAKNNASGEVTNILLSSVQRTGGGSYGDTYYWNGSTWNIDEAAGSYASANTGYTTTITEYNPSVYLSEGDWVFAYGFKLSASSGKAIDTNRSGINTTNYLSTTAQDTIAFQSTDNEEFTIPISSEIMEITSKGIQIISDSTNNRYVTLEKYPSAGMTGAENLLTVKNGVASMTSASIHELRVTGSLHIKGSGSFDMTGSLNVTGSLTYPAIGWRLGKNATDVSLTTAGTWYGFSRSTSDPRHFIKGVNDGTNTVTITKEGFYLVGIAGMFAGKNDNDEYGMRVTSSGVPLIEINHMAEGAQDISLSATTMLYLSSSTILVPQFVNQTSNTDTLYGDSQYSYWYGVYIGTMY